MKEYLLLFILIPISLFSQIKFEEGTWKESLKKAKEYDKLIFLTAYAEWCDPCEEIEEYTFTDLEVSDYYNSKFINVRMNMEDYPGVELTELYSINVFPSFLFIKGDGEVVHRGCGTMNASQFLNLGDEAQSDAKTLAFLNQKFDEGDRSVDFMLEYLALLEEVCLNAEQFATNYLNNLNVSDLTNETAWEVFVRYQWDIYSREFQYVLKNRTEFENKIDEHVVDGKLYDTYLSQYQEIFESEELHGFAMRALLHEMEDQSFVGSDTLKLMMKLHYAEFTENWEDYADYAIELVGMTKMEDSEELNELAWKVYLFIENRSQLEIASSWVQQSIDKLPLPSIIDTYASIQFKLGHKKKAIELEKRALELAQGLNDDTSHYEYQLKKFEEDRKNE